MRIERQVDKGWVVSKEFYEVYMPESFTNTSEEWGEEGRLRKTGYDETSRE
jgi:hypothetical protein